MQPISLSELVLNEDGTIYHLHLNPEQIADTIILVGDPGRVKYISQHFDRIDHKISNREFLTHTGYIGEKRLTVLSTGIGTDNIDIVLNELDALININLNSRIENKQKKSLNIIRIGTSGSIQKNIKLDSYLVSEYGMGLDNLMHYYLDNYDDKKLANYFNKHSNWPKELSQPYFYSGCNRLLKKFDDLQSGITATAPGFYAPQGRKIRLPLAIKDLHEQLQSFKYKNLQICNFEMETSALYGLGKMLNHNCLTICAVIANRAEKKYSKNYKRTIQEMIAFVLERLTEK